MKKIDLKTPITNAIEAERFVVSLVKVLGVKYVSVDGGYRVVTGFHPDTLGADYSYASGRKRGKDFFTSEQADDIDSRMGEVFNICKEKFLTTDFVYQLGQYTVVGVNDRMPFCDWVYADGYFDATQIVEKYRRKFSPLADSKVKCLAVFQAWHPNQIPI